MGSKNHSSRKSEYKRGFGLFLVVISAVLVVLILLDIIIAFTFVSRLTHPHCYEPVPFKQLTTHEEHWLHTSDGISIRIWYFPSQNGAAIIVFGGLTGALNISAFPIETLVKEGFGVLLVDSRSCAIPPSPVTLGGKEILDGVSAIEFLIQRPEVDKDKIGAMGFSLGGATVIRLASNYPEIKAVVRDGGFTNLGDLLDPQTKSSIPIQIFQKTIIWIYQIQTGENPWSISPIDEIEFLSPRSVMLIYGEFEARYGYEQHQRAKEPKDLWIVPGGQHGANYSTSPKEYQERLLKFFKSTLISNPLNE